MGNRITRVYTKVGDRGTTRLVGSHEVAKDDARIEAYGTVDELNAVLGLVCVALPDDDVRACLLRVQNDLFNVGADLATRPADRWPGMFRVGEADISWLEARIDAWNEALGPLREFILPGGGEIPARLHLARTVCRRAERRVVTLMRAEDDVGDGVLIYLNRLSDLLFVLARHVTAQTGAAEVLWRKPS